MLSHGNAIAGEPIPYVQNGTLFAAVLTYRARLLPGYRQRDML